MKIWIAIIVGLGFSLSAEESLPLNLSSGWKALDFSKGNTNRVEELDGSLKVIVDQSAGPLIYQFSKARNISNISFKGRTDGLVQLAGKPQGLDDTDDFVLRVGLIYAGTEKLNRLQLALAPGWIKELVHSSPNQTMISKLVLYNVANGKTEWTKRNHPQSKGLIEEHIVQNLSQPGQIELNIETQSANPVIGIWLSCDGDETQSKFNVWIDALTIE